jgi:DNA-binding PadR family transcriptional regulator
MSLLGFLHQGPMTGWNLVATVDRQIGEFWSVTQSQVYRELATMAQLGFVEAGELGPRDRRPYMITETGRRAFRQWLAIEPGPETMRFPLLLTVLFGEHLPPGQLGRFIEEHRQLHTQRLAHYETQLETLAAPPRGQADPHLLATARFGVAYERAVLDWFADLPPEITSEPAVQSTMD